jgi:uncharacterized protein
MMKKWQPTPKEIDNTKNWGTWNKEVSEFTWFYDEKETCLIISGEALVTDDNGDSIHFKTGDMVNFEKGHKCKWKIIKDVEKKYKFG